MMGTGMLPVHSNHRQARFDGKKGLWRVRVTRKVQGRQGYIDPASLQLLPEVVGQLIISTGIYGTSFTSSITTMVT